MTQIPSISRILFATNLSETSAYTMRHALGLAKATGAELHILYVCEALSEDAKVTLMMFVQDDELRKKALEQRSKFAEKALTEHLDSVWATIPEGERAEMQKRVTGTHIVEGFPADVILRQAMEHQCDLIVLGAHEHGLSHTFIGTVAKRVMRRATIPTLIVPYQGDP